MKPVSPKYKVGVVTAALATRTVGVIKSCNTYSQNTTILATSSTLSINYMFRPPIGHHQVVFNLSSNYTIYVVYSGRGGGKISFTIVCGINWKL